jgi:hypothetical protein
VTPAKSEALWVFNRRRRGTPPPGLFVKINGEPVPVGNRMKYVGHRLTIDSQWSFKPHFELLVPRVTAAANALCGLQPNISGAGVSVRRLYEGVDRFLVLYGVPICAEDLMASRHSLLLLKRLQRTTAIRTVRGYRTVSYASATMLVSRIKFLFSTCYARCDGPCGIPHSLGVRTYPLLH